MPTAYVIEDEESPTANHEDSMTTILHFRHGGGIAMRLPVERSWSKEEPKFYPLLQPNLPDKPYEQPQPPTMLYQAPEQGV